MATGYAAIENALLTQARKEAAAYAATRRQLAAKQLNDYTAELEKEFEAQKKSYTDRIYASEDEEVAVRNAASVKAALTRRQVREHLAGRGLSNAGVQVAALDGADNEKRTQVLASKAREKEVVRQVNLSVSAAYAAMRKKRQEKSRSLNDAAEKDILSHRTSLEKAARTRAGQIARSDKALALWEAGGY